MDLALVREKMAKSLNLLAEDLAALKAGRATPSLVERVMVEAYGSRMPLVELATITVVDSSQLIIAPFDQSILKEINRALSLDRDLGLSPVVEDNLVRLRVPPLNEERRQELVKLVSQKLEMCRVMIRQIRGEAIRSLKNEELSEDEQFRLEKEIQKITDEFGEKIEALGERKEKELLSL